LIAGATAAPLVVRGCSLNGRAFRQKSTAGRATIAAPRQTTSPMIAIMPKPFSAWLLAASSEP